MLICKQDNIKQNVYYNKGDIKKMHVFHENVSNTFMADSFTVQNYKFLQLTQQQEFKEFIFKYHI